MDKKIQENEPVITSLFHTVENTEMHSSFTITETEEWEVGKVCPNMFQWYEESDSKQNMKKILLHNFSLAILNNGDSTIFLYGFEFYPLFNVKYRNQTQDL